MKPFPHNLFATFAALLLATAQGEKQLQMYLQELQSPATLQLRPRLEGIDWKTQLEVY
jgi:hypothetical protein